MTTLVSGGMLDLVTVSLGLRDKLPSTPYPR